jgi:8-oxo-dGTP pyrophosphatase MutT (NUDIX family)
MQKPELIGREAVYKGKIVTVHRDTLRQNGHTVEREVVEHADSVAVVALDERSRVLLVRQYRHPVGELLWELPAGLLDAPDEDPLAAARRELAEETGVRADRWEPLVELHPSPGMTGEHVRIFLARELSEGDVDREPDEDLESAWVPLTEAVNRVRGGGITNGLAVAGLLAAAALR